MPTKIRLAVIIFFIVIWSMSIIGYIANIFAIWQGGMSTNILALRVAGIVVVPLGAILGWF